MRVCPLILTPRWLAWTDAHQAALRRTVPIATLGGPRMGRVDGTAAVMADGSDGFVFLCNPGPLPQTVSLVADESIGMPNTTAAGTWLLRELYPVAGRGWGTVTRTQAVAVTVPGSSVVVLRLMGALTAPLLVNASGTVVFDQPTLTLRLTNVTGPAGSRAQVGVYFVPTPATVLLDGVPAVYRVEPSEWGAVIVMNVVFSGDGDFGPMHAVGDPVATARFAGPGWLNATVTIPGRIRSQLAERAALFPVPYTPAEHAVSWLVPARLLLSIAFAAPSDDWALQAVVGGVVLPVARAYSSRGLTIKNCFLGFYVDLTPAVAFDIPLNISVHVSSATPAGQLLGLFITNVDLELGTARQV